MTEGGVDSQGQGEQEREAHRDGEAVQEVVGPTRAGLGEGVGAALMHVSGFEQRPRRKSGCPEKGATDDKAERPRRPR